jgi:hypothetical protein
MWGRDFPNRDSLNQILNNNHIARCRLPPNVWLTLPKDIWRQIFKVLFSHSDKMMFRATCKLFAECVTYNGYRPFVYMDDKPTVNGYILGMPYRGTRHINTVVFEKFHKSPNKPMKVPYEVTTTGPTHPEPSIPITPPLTRAHHQKKSISF